MIIASHQAHDGASQYGDPPEDRGVVTSPIDLEAFIDGQKAGGMSILVGVVAILVLISDGFDLAAIGLIAPALVKEWGLAPALLVPAFTAGIVGMMVGGPLFGTLGDRFGRKRLLIIGLMIIGSATLSTVAVRTPAELMILRFITGLGLGGVVPNVIALVAELVPHHLRGRMVIVATTGMVLGLSIAGMAMSVLGPRFGWRMLMLVGGAIPLIVAALTTTLPESIKFLVLHGRDRHRVISVARRLRPELAIPDDFVFRAEVPAKNSRRVPLRELLRGDLQLFSPLAWLILASTQLASFFAVTWLPTFLGAAGVAPAQASWQASLFSIGGLFASVMLIFVIDRFGVIALLLLLVLAAPTFVAVTLLGLPSILHLVIVAAAGFAVVGAQQAVITLMGLAYPTPLRSSGAGLGLSIGRLGSVAAPALGGLVLQLAVPTEQLMVAPALMLVAGAFAAAGLSLLFWRRFRSFRPAEIPIGSAPVPLSANNGALDLGHGH